MVDEVLIAERNAEHALADEGRKCVLDQVRITSILKTGGEALDQVDGTIGGSEQQGPGIGGDHSPCERGHHRASFDRCRDELFGPTLCGHRGAPLA
jgi:hypothetical protein